MIPRILLILMAFTSFSVASENPFTKKFGGPFNSVDPAYRKAVTEYGNKWLRSFSMLGKEGLIDKEAFKTFSESFAIPELAKLHPETEDEKRVKEAAAYLWTVFGYFVDSSSVSSGEGEKIEQFVLSATPPKEDHALNTQLTYTLVRFVEFASGKTLEEIEKGLTMPSAKSGKTLDR